MTKAIVTIVTGERLQNLWQTHARPTWEQYAARHGYSIILINQPIDLRPEAAQRSMSWQKLLVLEAPDVQKFDRVVWLDADILINPNAPCIVNNTPPEKIGAVRDQSILANPSLMTPFAKNNDWPRPPESLGQLQYQLNGLAPGFGYWLNGGVLVLSPRHHRPLLEHVYRHHQDRPTSYFEQLGLSFEILSRGLHHPLDPRFNALWLEYKVACFPFLVVLPSLTSLCVSVAMENSYFLHFARWPDEMAAYDPNVKMSVESIFVPTYLMEKVQAGMQETIRRVTDK